MKFSVVTLLSSVVFAATALAQSTSIGYPTDGATVQRGTNITVRVDQPNSITGSTELIAVLGIYSCSGDASTCLPPSESMGQVLYKGPFNPQYSSEYWLPPHQNFTVYVPADLPVGTSQLNLAHFSLVGASFVPLFELHNITVNVTD